MLVSPMLWDSRKTDPVAPPKPVAEKMRPAAQAAPRAQRPATPQARCPTWSACRSPWHAKPSRRCAEISLGRIRRLRTARSRNCSASGSTKIKRSCNSLGAFSMTGRGFTRLLGVACAAAFPFMLDALVLNSHRAFAQAAPASQGAGPRFRADGPNADEFGRKEGYPSCKGFAYIDETRCRVGALSRYDTLFPARTIAAPKQSVPLARAASEPVIRYSFAGLELTLDDYLNRQPVTGLLIAKDNTILVERYQYGRTDTDRLTSFSMAKSVVGAADRYRREGGRNPVRRRPRGNLCRLV